LERGEAMTKSHANFTTIAINIRAASMTLALRLICRKIEEAIKKGPHRQFAIGWSLVPGMGAYCRMAGKMINY
jgi:hypothetical protein